MHFKSAASMVGRRPRCLRPRLDLLPNTAMELRPRPRESARLLVLVPVFSVGEEVTMVAVVVLEIVGSLIFEELELLNTEPGPPCKRKK